MHFLLFNLVVFWLTTPEVSPKQACKHFDAGESVGLCARIPSTSAWLAPALVPHETVIWWNTFCLISSVQHFGNQTQYFWLISELTHIKYYEVNRKCSTSDERIAQTMTTNAIKYFIVLFWFCNVLYEWNTSLNITGDIYGISSAIYTKILGD